MARRLIATLGSASLALSACGSSVPPRTPSQAAKSFIAALNDHDWARACRSAQPRIGTEACRDLAKDNFDHSGGDFKFLGVSSSGRRTADASFQQDSGVGTLLIERMSDNSLRVIWLDLRDAEANQS